VPPRQQDGYFSRCRGTAWSLFLIKSFRPTFKSVNPLVYFFLYHAVFTILRQHFPISYFGLFLCCVFVDKDNKLYKMHGTYEGCPESIRPFWISREPTIWPWCNLAPSRRRPYCASVNSHSPVGLVSRQWDAVDWVCVLCDRRIHKDRPGRSASLRQCACPFYSSHAGFFGNASHHPGLSAPTAQIWLPGPSGFSQS
jgi:hypothetical protein